MDDIRSYIPKSKSDPDAIERLKALDPSDLEPIIEDLLDLIQDPQWPIVDGIISILRRLGTRIVPYIREIIVSDPVRAGWMMYGFVETNREVFEMLKNDLVRMATHPTDEEKDWGTADTAREMIEKHKNFNA